METFDENAFATHLHMQVDAHVSAQNLESIKVHQPGVEAAWSTTAQLREAAELVVYQGCHNGCFWMKMSVRTFFLSGRPLTSAFTRGRAWTRVARPWGGANFLGFSL
jgi:hypothetical protein